MSYNEFQQLYLSEEHRGKTVSAMVDTFFKEVKEYADGAEHSDDITVLVLEYLRR
ncbi:MAG: SpoIIE family protein phosphatase [Opitutales bacterium]|nr:SpoIIE family protein phosphatase [Opitutales bacterium]MCH8540073.1 serine/threonine-protein phosphatase [Opitutales bacterium]